MRLLFVKKTANYPAVRLTIQGIYLYYKGKYAH